jgi:uncharacterized protein YjbI with pentapeptide repeats
MKARSDKEILLWLELHPCERCGNAMGEQDFERHDRDLGGGRAAYEYSGTCAKCGNVRSLRFELPQAWVDGYGGDQPSELIAADELLRKAEQLATGVPDSPDSLVPEQFFDNNRRLAGAIALLGEVLKFIPARAAEVPASAFFSPAGDADRRSDPSRYQRSALEARVAALRQQRDRYGKLSAQMSARSGAGKAPPAARFDRAALDAHKQWLARGQQGEGRLVVEGIGLAGLKLGSSKLGGARLVRVDLDRAVLDFANLKGAELVDCSAIGTNFAHAIFDDAVLERCKFERADLGLCDLKDVRIVGGSFARAGADRSVWNRAYAGRVDFRDMLFGDAVLDGVVFEDCDMRGADLSRVNEVLRGLCTTLNATFRRCDLRGAKIEGRRLDNTEFVDCQLAGIVGMPVIEGPYTVTGGDGAPAWGPSR